MTMVWWYFGLSLVACVAAVLACRAMPRGDQKRGARKP